MQVTLKTFKDEATFEHWIRRLEQIRAQKDWTLERAGKEFAELLIKEPQVVMQRLDSYGDDYGYEDYGPEVYQNQIQQSV